MNMGRVALESTRDTAAHLRNRRPPNVNYLKAQEGCHEEANLGVTVPAQWGALRPYSHIDSLPQASWHEARWVDYMWVGTEETSGSEKNMRGTYSFHSDPSLVQVGLIT